jgi:phosphatidate cytidylyltransferase
MSEASHAGGEPVDKADRAGSPGKPSGGFGDLAPRVLSALALVAAASATLYAGGHVFALFWLAAAFAVHWEWQGLIGGARRLARVALGAAGLAAAAGLAFAGETPFALLELVLSAAIVAVIAESGRRLWAAAGVVYAGALVVSVCMLRGSPQHGLLAIAWLFAVVWGTDVFAYFGGRLIGGPKLWPRVSAGKTWSGTIVGLSSGAALGVAAVGFGAGSHSATLALFVIGLVVAALAQIGDLAESAVKRRFGVKDSSRLIPGHGGVMDRVDGFIFASVFAALLGALRDPSAPAAGLFFW